MKFILSILATLAVVFATAQDMEMPPVPTETKQLSWLLGSWKGTGTSNSPMGEAPMTSTAKGSVELGERWFVLNDSLTTAGMTFSGRTLIAYNPESKMWEGVYIESMSHQIMHVKGTYANNVFTFTSDEIEMEGMGKVRFQGSFTKVSATAMKFELKMATSGSDEWMPAISISYTKDQK